MEEISYCSVPFFLYMKKERKNYSDFVIFIFLSSILGNFHTCCMLRTLSNILVEIIWGIHAIQGSLINLKIGLDNRMPGFNFLSPPPYCFVFLLSFFLSMMVQSFSICFQTDYITPDWIDAYFLSIHYLIIIEVIWYAVRRFIISICPGYPRYRDTLTVFWVRLEFILSPLRFWNIMCSV